MPLEAMTGFGTARKESPNGDISVDVKSLNNKYLDISIKTYQYSNELESLVKNNIKQLFDRGSFEVRIDINIESLSEYAINHSLLKKFLTTVNTAGINLTELSLNDIARVPGILDTKTNNSKLIKALKPVLKNALADLHVARIKEGKKIAMIFSSKLRTLHNILKKFEMFQSKAINYRKRVLRTKHSNLGLPLCRSRQ